MLAIAGGKGGCGKTTTTLGLADAFARAGLTPLVVDGDCDMPDLHHRTAVQREPGVDALASGVPLEEVTRQSPEFPGVTVVPGGRRQHLGAALRAVEHWNGPVLVDCAAGINPDSLMPLRYADSAIVVSTDRPQCLEDAADTYCGARRLDTLPLGILIRDTGCKSSSRVPPDWHELARVPSVENPLSAPRVRETWDKLSILIIRGEMTVEQAAGIGGGEQNLGGHYR